VAKTAKSSDVTGRPKTGGRQRGARNKRTLATERALADVAAKITGALGADAFQGDAHSLLIAVYKDTTHPIELRVLAAKAAIGYEQPRLAAIEGRVDGKLTLEQLVGASMAIGSNFVASRSLFREHKQTLY